MPLVQLQIKLVKTAEITYLKGNKQQTRYQSKKKGTIDALKVKVQHES